MLRTPSRAVRLAVEAAKVAVVGVVAVVAVSPVLQTAPVTSQAEAGPTPADRAEDARVAALMERHGCSTDGLGPDVIPGSALVERGDRVQQVGFDDGWAVFTGDADGRLVAVCRADVAR
ncbi:hypothetical protein [Nocardioides litoris]|uniref:hypothetical protein n=1 Tax=Nocardioides litoris TaxID=1926648 RepID=UPI00111F011B|nr:hypothetical protein [Nocardioides litoris]